MRKQILYANSKQKQNHPKITFKIPYLGFRDFNQAIFELTMAVAASTFLKTTEPVVFCLLSLA
jgi:hypothetical protein